MRQSEMDTHFENKFVKWYKGNGDRQRNRDIHTDGKIGCPVITDCIF